VRTPRYWVLQGKISLPEERLYLLDAERTLIMKSYLEAAKIMKSYPGENYEKLPGGC